MTKNNIVSEFLRFLTEVITQLLGSIWIRAKRKYKHC